MTKSVLLSVSLLFSVSAFSQTQIDFFTSKGNFRVEVREDLMPITAGNFISLVDTGFYDGLIFHRVVKDFVIQGGDPAGNGTGGPGYTIEDEYHPQMNHDSAGVLAMAKSAAPNSAGSQFYFTLDAQPQLNQNYAVFGSCIQGLDVILEIGCVAVQGNDKPWVNVYMDSLRIVDNTSSVRPVFSEIPTEIFPNPIKSKTQISYKLDAPSRVRATLVDAQGRQIQVLFEAEQIIGVHAFEWDASALPAGLYWVTVQTENGRGVRRVVKY